MGDRTDGDLFPAVVYAALLGKLDMLKLLQRAGVDLEALGPSDDGYLVSAGPALEWAAYQGHDETVASLLGWGANKNAVEKDGKTALHHAAEQGQLGCARLLVAADPDRTKTDKAGKTALDLAKEQGKAEIVALLEDADPATRAFAELPDELREMAGEALLHPAVGPKLRELEARAAEGPLPAAEALPYTRWAFGPEGHTLEYAPAKQAEFVKLLASAKVAAAESLSWDPACLETCEYASLEEEEEERHAELQDAHGQQQQEEQQQEQEEEVIEEAEPPEQHERQPQPQPHQHQHEDEDDDEEEEEGPRYHVGQAVEVYSRSTRQWLRGQVVTADEAQDTVTAKYVGKGGKEFGKTAGWDDLDAIRPVAEDAQAEERAKQEEEERAQQEEEQRRREVK
eukprot:COSAG04_NODE_733_length_10713_cov_8.864236_8_plen_398_part_00